MTALDPETIGIASVALVALIVLVLARRYRRGAKSKRKIEENRVAAQYLNRDPDQITDSRPVVKRARLSIIMTSLIVLLLIYIATFG